MKRLAFEYSMQIEYTVEVGTCNFTIKCMPKNNLRQEIEGTEILLFPETKYCTGKDGFNNIQIYGRNEMPHKTFLYKIKGIAKTGINDSDELFNDNLDMVFRHPHGLNVPGENIRAYYEKLRIAGTTNLERAVNVMHMLHQDFNYTPGSTWIDTTAEEAFSQGCGVCQDYAHIFISLMQLAGIPARYVTGLIVGEGASHAWVEILDGSRWYGLDPTNDTKVFDSHIKIGIGRDAGDCMINRGIMHGGGPHTQYINVSVKEI